jgi:hypothetical protein
LIRLTNRANPPYGVCAWSFQRTFGMEKSATQMFVKKYILFAKCGLRSVLPSSPEIPESKNKSDEPKSFRLLGPKSANFSTLQNLRQCLGGLAQGPKLLHRLSQRLILIPAQDLSTGVSLAS